MPDANDQAKTAAAILEALRTAGLVRSDKIEERRAKLPGEIAVALAALPARVGPFAPCADVLLATLHPNGTDTPSRLFREYFKYSRHQVIPQGSHVQGQLPADLLKCEEGRGGWPPDCCVPGGCVTLCGDRHLRPSAVAGNPNGGRDCLDRLFLADVMWLYFMDRMGLMQILGAILDDYAARGRFPIFSNTLEGVIIETMIGQLKSGEASTVKERCTLYLRAVGLKTDATDKLDLKINENGAFHSLFHRFLQTALEFYRYNRLRDAIQSTTDPSRPSMATLTAIRDLIGLMKKTFDAFEYGRTYTNTVSGIVWVVATLGLVRNLRRQLGIPETYDEPHEYIPAAYELLVTGKTVGPTETNRFVLHLDAARYARRVLLDLQVMDFESGPISDLEAWLMLVEDQVEGYRAAYRGISRVDLGTPAGP